MCVVRHLDDGAEDGAALVGDELAELREGHLSLVLRVEPLERLEQSAHLQCRKHVHVSGRVHNTAPGPELARGSATSARHSSKSVKQFVFASHCRGCGVVLTLTERFLSQANSTNSLKSTVPVPSRSAFRNALLQNSEFVNDLSAVCQLSESKQSFLSQSSKPNGPEANHCWFVTD